MRTRTDRPHRYRVGIDTHQAGNPWWKAQHHQCTGHLATLRAATGVAPVGQANGDTRKGTLLASIRTHDSGDGTEHPAHTQKIEELEFQRALSIPTEFRQRNIPAYFMLPARRIRLALSFRMRGKRIDCSQPGHYFYPLGARDGATGIALSVCAPFEMNANRSDLVAPEASQWNNWLLAQAIAAAQELLTTDWLVRFGADAYLALFHPNPSPAQPLAYLLHAHLREATCWPTRARQADQPKQPVFKKAADVVVPDAVALDGFLADSCYLDQRLGCVAKLREVVDKCGARRFSANSLVRLRCAGKDAKALKTQLKEKEKEAHYRDFSERLRSLKTQCKLATALDAAEQRLSPENKADLRATPQRRLLLTAAWRRVSLCRRSVRR